MRKLLTILGAIGLTAVGATPVVSCGTSQGPKDKDKDKDKDPDDKNPPKEHCECANTKECKCNDTGWCEECGECTSHPKPKPDPDPEPDSKSGLIKQ